MRRCPFSMMALTMDLDPEKSSLLTLGYSVGASSETTNSKGVRMRAKRDSSRTRQGPTNTMSFGLYVCSIARSASIKSTRQGTVRISTVVFGMASEKSLLGSWNGGTPFSPLRTTMSTLSLRRVRAWIVHWG